MLDADELEELRSLQARAYGREVSLTAADAVRLRELEDLRVTRAPEPAEHDTAGPDPAPIADRAAGSESRDLHADADAPVPVSVSVSAEAAEEPTPRTAPLRTLMRAHWRPLALAAVAVLVVGVGVGWLAFGRTGTAPVELTAEQQGWQDDLIAEGNYDPGSVRALAVKEGAVIWTATSEASKNTCLILSTGEMTTPSCDRTDRIAESGIYGAIIVRDADDVRRQVTAQMLMTAAGEPAVSVGSYDYEATESGITYANEAESQTAERLADDGFEPSSLWVVGYDGDVPVWTATQLDSQNRCLIYDGSTADAPMTCADPETMQDQASSLVLNVTDVATGDVTHLELPSTLGPAYLVITRQGSVVGAGGD